eukprot:TRINITY_DN10587_c0_g2_i1.p1 TRINITY_DN10587_c0_g2~~TRINITY_DN10587_c0_g2_i1.p1  ORF type:complete len:222 (+),score=62.96 TRINITY_DN10587_c0_g2_i1:133-798(+)
MDYTSPHISIFTPVGSIVIDRTDDYYSLKADINEFLGLAHDNSEIALVLKPNDEELMDHDQIPSDLTVQLPNHSLYKRGQRIYQQLERLTGAMNQLSKAIEECCEKCLAKIHNPESAATVFAAMIGARKKALQRYSFKSGDEFEDFKSSFLKDIAASESFRRLKNAENRWNSMLKMLDSKMQECEAFPAVGDDVPSFELDSTLTGGKRSSKEFYGTVLVSF